MRQFLRNLFYFLFNTLTRLTIVNRERLPESGPCLVVANHLSITDGPLVFCLLPHKKATALVANTHRKNALFRWIVNRVGGIWIDRENADIGALKAARAHIREGGLLGITPEGTRSRAGSMLKAKPGAAYLAATLDAPILPLAISGTENIFNELMRLRRAEVRVVVGEPFTLPPLERKDRDAALQRNTDEIMCRIAVMLPEPYRGHYAGHPRLAELATAGD